VSVSKVWAHAWVDYLFYDTELFYSIVRNKNYELPDPPVDYVFRSVGTDHMLNVNVYHAYIIKVFHTPHSIFDDKTFDFLSERDMRILKLTLQDHLTEVQLQLIERQTNKMILKILKNPQNWVAWLQLFDDENNMEETLPTEEKKDSANPSPDLSPNASFNARDQLLDSDHKNSIFEKFKYMKDAHKTDKFVLKQTPSECQEMDAFDASRHQSSRVSKSVIPKLDFELSDIDSQFLSPRFHLIETSHRSSHLPQQPSHKRTESERRYGLTLTPQELRLPDSTRTNK